MNKAHKGLLRENFEKAVKGYTDALLSLWDLDERYIYWVSDAVGGILAVNDDYFINLDDIIFCVENDVSFEEVIRWQDYCVEASSLGFTVPNLSSWVRGCPRVPDETFEKLRQAKQTVSDIINEEKERLSKAGESES